MYDIIIRYYNVLCKYDFFLEKLFFWIHLVLATAVDDW